MLSTRMGSAALIPAALAVLVEKWIMRRHHASITERSQPLALLPDAWRDRVGLAYAVAIAALVAMIVAVVFVASSSRSGRPGRGSA